MVHARERAPAAQPPRSRARDLQGTEAVLGRSRVVGVWVDVFMVPVTLGWGECMCKEGGQREGPVEVDSEVVSRGGRETGATSR